MSAAVAEHAGELGRGTKAPAAALTKAAAMGLHLVGFVPVYLAAQINFQSAASQGPDWANLRVVSTILTAILFETAVLLFMRRMFLSGIAATALVVPFFAVNMLAASGNVASADMHSHEVRKLKSKLRVTLSAYADYAADCKSHNEKPVS